MREATMTAAPAGSSSLANRWWRVGATGFSFALFGIGGLLLGVVVFPLLLAVLRHHQRRSALARRIIHHLFRAFVGVMCALRVCSLEVRGRERLERRGLLILANHPSLIDVVFLMALVRHADCVVKGALVRNPFTRGPVRAAGWVCNDSGPGLIDDCVASLRAGNNLIIFPEGTRTPAGQTRKYGVSGALLASETGCLIVPVAHDAGSYWPRRGLLKQPGVIRVVIGPPIPARDRNPREINRDAQTWIESTVNQLTARPSSRSATPHDAVDQLDH